MTEEKTMTYAEHSAACKKAIEDNDGKPIDHRAFRCPTCLGDGYTSSRCRRCAGQGFTLDGVRIEPYPYKRCPAKCSDGEVFTGDLPEPGEDKNYAIFMMENDEDVGIAFHRDNGEIPFGFNSDLAKLKGFAFEILEFVNEQEERKASESEET